MYLFWAKMLLDPFIFYDRAVKGYLVIYFFFPLIA